MKAKITLIGPGGILDVATFDIDDETDDRISNAVEELAARNTLAIGDTITITEA